MCIMYEGLPQVHLARLPRVSTICSDLLFDSCLALADDFVRDGTCLLDIRHRSNIRRSEGSNARPNQADGESLCHFECS